MTDVRDAEQSGGEAPVVRRRSRPGPARLAVVGGGFTGVLTAIHLLWRCRKGERVYLFERSGALGPGTAFATPYPEHLMNVRAGNGSAFEDEPDHFERWLARHPESERGNLGVATTSGFFARRSTYAAYIQELLRDALLRQGGSTNFFLVDDACEKLRESAGGLELVTAMGRTHTVDSVVLATGVSPPDFATGPGYVGNPWALNATEGLAPNIPVLLIGTGLTMVDMCLALRARGFSETIHAISRRGLLPRAHDQAGAWTGLRITTEERTSLSRLTRAFRREVLRAARLGVDWRAVVDAARPRFGDTWSAMGTGEQARFLRHLRPWWEVHRHRMEPPIHSLIIAEIEAGTLRAAGGRIASATWTGQRAEIVWHSRRLGEEHRLAVQRVINCTGLGGDVAASPEPLIRHLLDGRLARPDAHGLGLATAADGRLQAADSSPSRPIFALGPITRGTSWETTSIPDLRNKAEQVAVAALAAARARARLASSTSGPVTPRRH